METGFGGLFYTTCYYNEQRFSISRLKYWALSVQKTTVWNFVLYFIINYPQKFLCQKKSENASILYWSLLGMLTHFIFIFYAQNSINATCINIVFLLNACTCCTTLYCDCRNVFGLPFKQLYLYHCCLIKRRCYDPVNNYQVARIEHIHCRR